jgi:hypothetical protein
MRIGDASLTKEARGIAALLIVFALMVEALAPSAAMAADWAPPGGMVICTSEGMVTAPVDGDAGKANGFAGVPCQDCLAAAMAFLPAPELAVLQVAYVGARVEHASAPVLRTPCARAPPRPPGQGPPTT